VTRAVSPRRLAGLASLGLLLLAGCAKPARDDLYVLLPSQDGHSSGAVTVESGGKQAILDQPYEAARVKEPGRVEPGTVTPEQVQQAFGPALAAQPPRPVSFILYFLENRDELTPESKPTLTQVIAEIARFPAPEIVVIGHTDRVGTVARNDALSLQRAESMRDELVKAGVDPAKIRVEGRGEREPLVPTPDEVAEPRNRRVEINLR
jgi:outer membrane protein OmpA-like peptidoglycan-associated protein